MARPTDKPRLAGVDAREVAADVVEHVLKHIARQSFGLAPAVTVGFRTPSRPEMAGGTDLGLTVQSLVAFAQRGELGDWPDASCALDALQTVCSALYTQAGVPGTFGVGDLNEATAATDPEDPLGLVLVGAHARAKLLLEQGITPRELGVLAGVTRQHATMIAADLGAEGPRPLTIAAEVARRWLRERGVPGF